jgi:phosphoribosylamine--glycine ligase
MGAWAPVLSSDAATSLVAEVHTPVLEELARRGAPFVGLLYAGIMLTEDGPRVLEFNCRFGDPESQAVLPLLETDLLEVLGAAARGDLPDEAIAFSSSSAVTVVGVGGGYPAEGDRGSEITGVEEAEAVGALVFHAGTARQGERLVTNGGRILAVTGTGPSVGDARDVAYRAVERIGFEGMRFRTDIAADAAAEHFVQPRSRPLDLPQ